MFFLFLAGHVPRRFDVSVGAERDARQVPRQPGWQRGREAGDLLFAVLAEDPQVEGAVGAPRVVVRTRDDVGMKRRDAPAGAGAFADALGRFEGAAEQSRFHGRRPRRQRGAARVRPAHRWADQRRGRTGTELQREAIEGLLRIVQERGGELPRDGIQFDPPRDLDHDPPRGVLRDDIQREQRPVWMARFAKWIVIRRGDIHRAGNLFREQRRFDFDRADLRFGGSLHRAARRRSPFRTAPGCTHRDPTRHPG